MARDVPYKRFQNEDLILRDQLALDRTQMANERTLLSYVRTAIMLVISGATLLKIYGSAELTNLVTAWALIGVGLFVAGWGLLRFRRVRRHLRLAGPTAGDAPIREASS